LTQREYKEEKYFLTLISNQAKKEVSVKEEQLNKVNQDLALEVSNVQRLNQELKSANQQVHIL
jgi:hypothetical protein